VTDMVTILNYGLEKATPIYHEYGSDYGKSTQTLCGKTANFYIPIRREHAEKIGKPCVACTKTVRTLSEQKA
jgi:hypothetical protein